MAASLPPAPIGEPPGSFAWTQWYLALGNLYSGTGTIAWSLINTSGSNLTDIVTRAHNTLQTIQGGTTGTYYHFKKAIKNSKLFDFPLVAAVNKQTTTAVVTGAAVGDVVAVTPSTELEAGIIVYGYVSAADTVTLVASNSTAGGIDPASRTYYIMVMDN